MKATWICIGALALFLGGCAVSDSSRPGTSPRASTQSGLAPASTAAKRHIRDLITRIDHDNATLRQSAMDELVQIGRPAVPILMETLTSDSVGNRAFASLILGRIGDRRAVEPIIWVLSTDHWFARRVAIVALGFLKDERAIEPLVRMARDPDERVRAELATSISAFADARAVITIIRLQSDPSEKVREQANRGAGYGIAYHLFKDRGRPNPAEIPALIRGLSDQNLQVRRFAAEELVNQPDPRAFNALAAALANSGEHEDVRAWSARAIGKIGGRRAMNALRKALKDSNVAVRGFAVVGLIELDDARAENDIIPMIRDRDRTVRTMAHHALVSLGGPRAYDVLLSELRREKPGVILRLGELGDRRAVGPILEYASHNDPRYRGNAMKALGDLGDPRAIPSLLEGLSDVDGNVRSLAGEALGNIDLAPDLVPMLRAVRRGDGKRIETLFDNAGSTGLGNVLVIYDLLDDDVSQTRKGATYALARGGAFTFLDKPPVSDAARAALSEGIATVRSSTYGDALKNVGQHFFDAIEIAPWWADAHHNLALWAESGQIWDLALEHFDLYLALAPDAEDARDVRGRISRLEEQRGEKPKLPGF